MDCKNTDGWSAAGPMRKWVLRRFSLSFTEWGSDGAVSSGAGGYFWLENRTTTSNCETCVKFRLVSVSGFVLKGTHPETFIYPTFVVANVQCRANESIAEGALCTSDCGCVL